MKYIYTALILLLFSCSEESGGNEKNEPVLTKITEIPNISVTLGVEPKIIQLSSFFTGSDSLSYSVTQTNSTVLSYAISQHVLTVTFNAVGETNVTATATLSGKTVNSTFKVMVNSEPDQSPVVANALADYSIVKNSSDSVINISSVFTDVNGDSFTYTAQSTNTSLATASISGNNLTVSYINGLDGTVKIAITATANGKSVSDEFEIIVIDRAPMLASAISNILVDLNAVNTVKNISTVFSDADGDSFNYKVLSSDITKVNATVQGASLTLSFINGAVGNADIRLIGTASDLSDTTTFSVTINDVSDSIISEGTTHFKNGDYSAAITTFNQLKSHQIDSVKSKAHAGLGFSYLRTEKISDAYNTFVAGVNQSTTIAQNDVKAGLTFLEYALKDNYQSAITNGLALLNSNANFQMIYDSGVDHKDVRLTVAQSYFEQKDYANCLVHVKILGKLANATDNDADLSTSLLNTLNTLANELK